MSLLKNLGDKAKSTAKIVGNKSQDLVEVGKLKVQITQLENDIKKLKSEIGEVVYNTYENGLEGSSEEVNALCEKVLHKFTEIEEIKVKMEEVKSD